MSEIEAETKPAPAYHLDRARWRKPADREAHFEHWWLKAGEPYQAAVLANGGTPWTTDVDERRELFMRRYTQPEPPAYLTIPDIRRSA